MSNFSFKGDTLYRLIPSGEGGQIYSSPPDSLMGGCNIMGYQLLYRDMYILIPFCMFGVRGECLPLFAMREQ